MPDLHDTPADSPRRRLPSPARLARPFRDPRTWFAVLVLGLTTVLLVNTGRSVTGPDPAQASETTPSSSATSTQGRVTLRQPDGGATYFQKFPNSLPNRPDFFPIGVWLESVTDAADARTDRAAGINTYVGLTRNSSLALVEDAGMHVIAQQEEWLGATDQSTGTIAGWMLTDEIDMIEGPVEGPKTMDRVQKSLPTDDGKLHYTNYGKGVTFWETDAEASVFVNRYQDVVSADNYWFTDMDICGPSQGGHLIAGDRELSAEECHLAANYGRTVDRVRALVDPPASKPVWNFVEVGHPFTENDWPSITPAQVRAAVWSSIIHGARGVVYFNHSFGGPDISYHALREAAYADVRTVVTAANAQITELAPVLNGPAVIGLVTNTKPVTTQGVATDAGTTTTGTVDVLAKWYDGKIYLLVGSTTPDSQVARLTMPCVGNATATVLGEDRTVRVTGGTLQDTFADGNAVHLYRLDGGSACGLT